MTRGLWSIAVAVWALGFNASAANATSILFEHPFPTPNTTSAWCSPCGATYRVWDVFDLATDSSISTIESRMYLSGSFSSANYSVWTVDRTTQLFSQSILFADLAITPLGFPANDFSAAITGLSLPAGSYALSIYGLGGGSSSQLAWFQTAVTVDGRSFQNDGGLGDNVDMAFRLVGEGTSPVPEPTTLALLGLGLVGSRFARRKRSA